MQASSTGKQVSKQTNKQDSPRPGLQSIAPERLHLELKAAHTEGHLSVKKKGPPRWPEISATEPGLRLVGGPLFFKETCS